ncbi:hypothetical protein LFE_0514 [Leptospirillum ferrooxidans C2-3]|uniref:Uncharacterized protein n=1 Tax=Leptospirillum ferrooxidans (strain C2-3) TaxID=1162668 RepID=I0ILT3_LEPFC|nr:hypothetical protein LFE_0514 [Leptospirillum ferrooxidans C2-3]
MNELLFPEAFEKSRNVAKPCAKSLDWAVKKVDEAPVREYIETIGAPVGKIRP